MLDSFIALQSEVIRAIVSDCGPCCGVEPSCQAAPPARRLLLSRGASQLFTRGVLAGW